MSPRKKFRLALRVVPVVLAVIVFMLGSGVVALGMACCLSIVAVDRGSSSTVQATVAAHHWSRSVEQLELRSVDREDWCDDMPDEALIVAIESKKRGIGRRRKWADWCTYAAEDWVVADKPVVEGDDLAPSWPEVADDSCERLGCRRPGDTDETYVVVLEAPDAESMQCEVDEPTWQALQAGTSVSVGIGGLTGRPLCDTLSQT